MTSRGTHGGRNQAAAPPVNSNRQNEYFVPRDGIDREVITADVCRYLGNDALVRPGTYENPQTGAPVQGYFITAYRNLTTAMIEDLKADSAKWDQERRAHSRNAPGGAQNYRYSETHTARQQQGPSAENPQYDNSYRDSYDQPRYPGTGTAGYTGASSGYGQPAASGYGVQGGGYGQAAYGGVTPQYAAQQDPRYAASMVQASYQQPEVYASGSNRPIAGTDPRYDPYGQVAAAAARDRMQSTMASPQAAIYATAGQTAPGYPATTQAQAQSYYQQQVPVPASGNPAYAASQVDPFYGRASPAGTTAQQGYPSAQGGQPYEVPPPIPRASTAASSAQTTSSGTTSSRRSERESDRHSDRHGSDRRHGRPSHRS